MSTELDPTATPRGSSEDPWIGTIVAERFRVVAKLGAGGAGAVYRAEHVTLPKRVAVKFLHAESMAHPQVVERFKREAQIASTLEHPNIATVIDFGTLPNGASFLVMEYVEGRSLRQVIDADGKLPAARAIRILVQIANALACAHREGVVHRDLKPENVLVADRADERDVVKVIDFGTARIARSNGPALTTFGTLFGTPPYMSPEQVMGQPAESAADQYALGIIAFELLTGSRPFRADDPADILRMHVGAPVPAMTTLAPELPSSADAVIARMLAKRPAERYERIDDAIRALERAFANAGSPRGSGDDDNARKRQLTIALATLLLLSIVLALATRHTPRAGPTAISPAGVASQRDPRPLEVRLAELESRPEIRDAFASLRPATIDTASAPLLARVRRDPHDGLAAYLLGVMYLRVRERGSALAQFNRALAEEPRLAGDEAIASAAVVALRDPSTSNDGEALLRGPLATSAAALRALADEALNSPSRRGRTAALALVESRADALGGVDGPRIRLRAARTCDELIRALTALEATNDDLARDEARAVRAGACDMLRIGVACRQCRSER
jgi:tRNA A-37 threonylcarbamoyl transferase component Bud32